MEIDSKTYKLKSKNYTRKSYKKTQIVVGHTSRKDMRHFEGWLTRKNGSYKKVSHFSIDKNGLVYQHFNPKYYSEFLGSGQDKIIISISLVNEGWLKLNDMNVFVDWLGHTYGRDCDFVERGWRDKRYWSKYSDEQMDSLSKLLDHLCEEYDIPRDVIENNVYDENIDIFKGITFRSNYFKDNTDVSPAFDIKKIKKD